MGRVTLYCWGWPLIRMASCRIKWLGRLNSHSPVPGSISDMAVVIGPLCFGLSKVAATLSASPRCARIQPDTALVTGKAQNAAHLAASMSKCAAFSTTPPLHASGDVGRAAGHAPFGGHQVVHQDVALRRHRLVCLL